jgi:hypothetical protein
MTPTRTPSRTPAKTATRTSTRTPVRTSTSAATPSPTPLGGGIHVVNRVISSGFPGTSADAGNFLYQSPSGGPALLIHSATISVSDPGVFSSFTLTCGAGGPHPAMVTVPSASQVTLNCPVPVPLSSGGQAHFSLAGMIAINPVLLDRTNVSYASLIGPAATGVFERNSPLLPVGVMLMLISLIAFPACTRRRTLLMTALALLLAASQLGCGSSSSTTPGSTQTIVAVAATQQSNGAVVAVKGLPAVLGSIIAR